MRVKDAEARHKIVSRHPYDLEPVEPVIEFQQAKYRFAEPVDALAGIDSRPDLLKMDWYKFENLIRQLFEAMGLEVHVTQSSRDEGIDAVAYNKTDIVHQAEILIQAKRYSKCVPANDVRALAGSVEEKRATSRRPGHHGLGQRRNQGLRRPQQQAADHRRRRTQAPPRRAPRPRRPHRPRPTAPAQTVT